MVGTTIMQNSDKTDSIGFDALYLQNCEDGRVAEWLTGMELALAAEDDDIRREYTNIGGKDGLELFV